MSPDNNHNHFRKTKKKKIFGAVHSECLLINRLSITQSGMSFSCRMEFLRHCGEPNRFWWRSLYIAQECILLCRGGMCGIGKGWPGIPKTIKLLKQMLLWGVGGEKVLIPLLLTSQCCHVRTSKEKSSYSTFPLSYRDGPLQNALALKWAITTRVSTEQPGWIPSSPRLRGSLEATCKCVGQNEPEVMYGHGHSLTRQGLGCWSVLIFFSKCNVFRLILQDA